MAYMNKIPFVICKLANTEIKKNVMKLKNDMQFFFVTNFNITAKHKISVVFLSNVKFIFTLRI